MRAALRNVGSFHCQGESHSSEASAFKRACVLPCVGATDASGPYHESISAMVDELHSDLPALLIPAPIGRDRTKGLSWDAEYTGDRIYVLNPSHSKPQTLQQLQFLGVFLGVAIRFVVSDADLFGSLSSVREPTLPHLIY